MELDRYLADQSRSLGAEMARNTDTDMQHTRARTPVTVSGTATEAGGFTPLAPDEGITVTPSGAEVASDDGLVLELPRAAASLPRRCPRNPESNRLGHRQQVLHVEAPNVSAPRIMPFGSIWAESIQVGTARLGCVHRRRNAAGSCGLVSRRCVRGSRVRSWGVVTFGLVGASVGCDEQGWEGGGRGPDGDVRG